MGVKSVITRTIAVVGGGFASGHLGEFTQLVSFELVDNVLLATRTVQSRLRGLVEPSDGRRYLGRMADHLLVTTTTT